MNNIFTHFIARGNADDDNRRLAYAAWFVDAIPSIEFTGDERLFCEYIEYSVDLGVPLNYKYLQVWLNTELREVLKNTQVHVSGCESLRFEDPASFETAYQTTVAVLSDDYNVLEAMSSDIDDFKVEVSAYFTNRRNERLTQSLADTFELLNKTNSSTQAADYVLDTVTAINDIYDVTKLDELDSDGVDTLDKNDMKFVTDFGIPAIDTDCGGIYTSQLVGIEAQSGTGKTRFALGQPVYRALTLHHKNVLFIALEQKVVEVESMLIACHVFHMFNIQISDKMIRQNNIPKEIQSQVEAAKYDLFKSGKYGKFKALELDLYVETFISKIRTLDRLHGPFDLICIDYMGLLESKPAEYKRELTEYEIIKTGFKQFKRYVRRNNKAGIAISQFNREGIAAGKADKEITTEMAQGGIAVYRNTDYNIAISMTEDMKLQQKRRFSQPKVRSSAGFPTFIADTRLGFCYFKQVVQKAV
jgi:hypothetical protein